MKVTMKFLSNVFLTVLAVASTSAFAPATPLTFAPRSSKSTLSMVADDAKVILVTGSSRGLGKSIALDLGKAGQKVIVNYVSDGSKEGADATVAEIKALGGDAIAVQADSKCSHKMSFL
jgi:short chain dehydrogenase